MDVVYQTNQNILSTLIVFGFLSVSSCQDVDYPAFF